MTPIMIDDTISEMATNAINTYEIMFTMSVTDSISVPTRSVYEITLSLSTSRIWVL